MRAIPCIHGKPAIRHCEECRRQAVNKSAKSHYDPERNKSKYQSDRFSQLARMMNVNARKFGAPGIVTADIYRRLTNGPCDYCKLSGLPMELDHIIPMSRGGTNDISNLHGVCRYCNRSKACFGEGEFLDWLNMVRAS